MSTYPIPCLKSSPTPSHMPNPNARKIQFSKKKKFVLENTLPSFGKYIGLPSEANCWIIFSERSWVRLRDELLDHSLRQLFEKSSLKFLSQPFSCHALTPIVLGCPDAYGMHYVNSKQFMLIYLHAYINTSNSHKSCYSIYNNNTKISSRGLINQSSNSFRITQTTQNHTTNHVNSKTLGFALFTATQVGISSPGSKILRPITRPFRPQQIPIN